MAGCKRLSLFSEKIIDELTEHPAFGTGKAEQLRGNLSGFWSRRLKLTSRCRWVKTTISTNELFITGQH
ncbi:MAG: type II toxin-antitoxin system YoeB family toxin [Chlorobium sp.]